MSTKQTFQLHGFKAILIIAVGLILNLTSFFTIWASTSDKYYLLPSQTLTLPRIFMQAAIILGWVGIIIHQYRKEKAAHLIWIASFILSILTIPLTLDNQMSLCEGAYISLLGSLIVILGTFFDITKFEIVMEIEEAENHD